MAQRAHVTLDYARSGPAQPGGALATAAVCVAACAFPVGAVISASLEGVRALPREAGDWLGFGAFALMGVVGLALGAAALRQAGRRANSLATRGMSVVATGLGLANCGLALFLLMIDVV